MIAMVTASQVAFWILAPVMVLLGIGLVSLRKPVHSALCMAGIMISLGVLYAVQEAPFLFVVQIIVYTGAIMMLFLFVVMMVGVDSTDSFIETIRGQRVLAVIAALAMAALLIATVGNAVTGEAQVLADGANAAHTNNPRGLAALLFNDYVVVFQATAALLIIATVGAMVLAHRERLKPKMTQKDLAAARMQAYATDGVHPGGRPNPGIFARHNGIDAPALLPDGTISELSVSETLRDRGVMLDGEQLAAATPRTLAAITDGEDDDE
ncbi:MAG: NADH-quinone oxidoreductase subunit J [Propionibacterium sp.]|nr:NADH-quinone oxidoreductase subunit J [Propionibacterium sp.]